MVVSVKVVLPAVRQSSDFSAQGSGFTPVEISPVTAFTNRLGLDQDVVDRIVDLVSVMHFEGEYLGVGIVNACLWVR